MNILYLATRYPFPIEGGRERMISQIISFFNTLSDSTIYFVCFKKDIRKRTVFKNKNIIYICFPFPSFIDSLLSLKYIRLKTLQELLFYSNKIDSFLSIFFRNIHIDIAICDMIRMAQYIEYKRLSKIIDYDDLLSSRYKQMLNDKSLSIDLLGSFKNIFKKAKNNHLLSLFSRTIIRLEYLLIKHREKEIIKHFDQGWLITSKEKMQLANQSKTNKELKVVSPIVFNIQETTPLTDNQGKLKCFFIGNMFNTHNLDSIMKICDTMHNTPCSSLLSLDIFGKIENKNIFNKYSFVTYKGFVDDLNSLGNQYHLLLSPISYGSGIKTKILDSLALGIPVITNECGTSGLQPNYESCIFTIGEYNELNELITHLNINRQLLDLKRINIKEYLTKNYSKEKVFKTYLSSIKQVTEIK